MRLRLSNQVKENCHLCSRLEGFFLGFFDEVDAASVLVVVGVGTLMGMTATPVL